MKKFLLSILSVLLMLPTMAQTTMPPTYRFGNKYSVGNETMNKRAYEGYLKNTCPAAYNRFHSGRVTANAGWGVFAGGVACSVAGLGCLIGGAVKVVNDVDGDDNAGDNVESVKKFAGAASAGTLLMVVGPIATTTGIICLGVGYSRMHRAADIYNAEAARVKPQAYFSLDAVPGGVGLAYHF